MSLFDKRLCCLELAKVLKGTQRCGRIEHDLVHGQTVANMERINQLSKHHEHVYTDLNPGSTALCLSSTAKQSLVHYGGVHIAPLQGYYSEALPTLAWLK